jgi:hypothetical protein
MNTNTPAVFRTPILILALADLALLGARLWPWPEVTNLPGGSTTGVDPAIALIAYIVISAWISGIRTESARKALFSSALIGLLAGLFLVGNVALANQPGALEAASLPDRLQIGLILAAVGLWGVAGASAVRSGETLGLGALCSAWSAMVSCLMGGAALLALDYLTSFPDGSPAGWNEYQGVPDGAPAVQSLVRSLDMVTGFLLLGPILASIIGTLFGSFVKPSRE